MATEQNIKINVSISKELEENIKELAKAKDIYAIFIEHSNVLANAITAKFVFYVAGKYKSFYLILNDYNIDYIKEEFNEKIGLIYL